MRKIRAALKLVLISLLTIGILALAGGCKYILITTQEPELKENQSQQNVQQTETPAIDEEANKVIFDKIDGFTVICLTSDARITVSGNGSDGNRQDNNDVAEEEEQHEQEETNSEFIFPDSDTELLTEEEVNEIDSVEELREAINYIYAKAGRIFSNDMIQDYFEKYDWYVGIYTGAEMDSEPQAYLTATQYKNIQMLAKRRDELKANGGY